ncbi:transposase [Dysgonomonas sp. Marseille-P4677]|uniref:transposase n=1 Tax=Dysgonomonas sp. Marseille-P4677 TaxID=2364790 RepID=UPI001F2F2960|nr:transposase [Dysgonomonas sp. Marseille-P4677]
MDSFIPDDCDLDISLIDSMLIITCAGRNREAKVARGVVNKGFCSTKKQYYYGLKLHALAFSRKDKIPFPESITFSPTEDNDLTIFKLNLGDLISNRIIFGDKIYSDFEYFNDEKKLDRNIEMLTPVKSINEQSEQEKQRNKAFTICFQTLFLGSDSL